MMTKLSWLLAVFISGYLLLSYADTNHGQIAFKNLIENNEDSHTRASIGYMLHRAWVQMTGENASQNTIAHAALDIERLARHDYAVAWLGHDSMLIRIGDQWVLTDPIFSEYASPVPPFGPKRLVPLPFELSKLPPIDVVLISHDHYDHLDLATVRALARQPAGSPQFLVGSGLKDWFKLNVPESKVEEMQWWDTVDIAGTHYQFVPAQHSSGRHVNEKNKTLWGGWVMEYKGKKVYFAGDTAYERELFQRIHQQVGHITLAALPIGAYTPGAYMRYEHMGPGEAVKAHVDLQPDVSIAVHWGTFQLGDETSDTIRADLFAALAAQDIYNFKRLDIGQMIQVIE